MVARSAGILLYRERNGAIEVLIGHMGGPYWARTDVGAWSIPKGEVEPGEDELDVARREFLEEIGIDPPESITADLGQIRQSSGKVVRIWAAVGDLDATMARSTTFDMEWPPRSGRVQAFPEIDRAAWVPTDRARELLVRGQVAFVDRLCEVLDSHSSNDLGMGD